MSFTGSGRIGAMVAATAAQRNIRYQTEMGGKNVAIVMPDADLRQAAALTAAGAMRYAGQKCTATSRVIVAREVEDAFLTELRSQVAALPHRPSDGSRVGGRPGDQRALASSRSSGRSMRWTPSGIIENAIPTSAEFATRLFHCADRRTRRAAIDSDLAQRELFGPVLAEFVAEDLDHAIALANRHPYGLSASLFTRDLRSALELHRSHRSRAWCASMVTRLASIRMRHSAA